jgi:hypothetical protein
MSDDDREVVNAMADYGGDFVKALAVAMVRADAGNFQILKNAFPVYWNRYAERVATEHRLAAREAQTEGGAS